MSTEIIDTTATDAIAALEAQMAAAANQLAVGGSGAITFISAKSGMLNLEGQPIPGNSIDAVLVDVWGVNAYYAGAYDADNISGPDCTAFDRNLNLMVPHVDSPNPQHKSCEGCPMNEWGSGARGKGKACKNTRLAVFLMADGLANGTNKLFALRVPVTSVKNLTQYAAVLGTSGLSPMRVRTQISVKPDAKTQFKINFAMVDKLPADANQMRLVLDAFNTASTAVPQALAPQVDGDADESPADEPAEQSKKF